MSTTLLIENEEVIGSAVIGSIIMKHRGIWLYIQDTLPFLFRESICAPCLPGDVMILISNNQSDIDEFVENKKDKPGLPIVITKRDKRTPGIHWIDLAQPETELQEKILDALEKYQNPVGSTPRAGTRMEQDELCSTPAD